MEQEAYRHVPYDIEVEQALLGAMLLKPRAIDTAAAEITAEAFYDPLHARLFDMIVYLSTEGDVTPIIVHAVMKSDPGLVEVGGMKYLAGLLSVAGDHVQRLSKIVLELHQRRALIQIGEGLVNEAFESPRESPSRGIADKATERLLGLGAAVRAPMISAYQSAMESARQIEEIWRGESPGITTGLEKVDQDIGTMRPTDFIVIPAKPGMGKSALMAGVALHAALAGFPVKVFSLEMTRQQWVDRNVCDLDFDRNLGPLPYGGVRNGFINRKGEYERDYLDRYVLASARLDDITSNYEIDEEVGLTVQQINARSRAFMAKHKGKPCLIVVDYIQKVEPLDHSENRERQVARVAMGLKGLAKREGCVVLAGSQLNEDDQKRSADNQRPRSSDVRESKVIIQEADLVLSPWRPLVAIINRKPLLAHRDSAEWTKWLSDYRDNKHKFELLGLKHRHGQQRDIELHCDMAASVIRDREPIIVQSAEAERAQADMLEGL